jgi:hypothetical protein
VKPSASALPRLFACPGSAAVPQARVTSVWSDAGEERHGAREDAVKTGRLDDLPDAVRKLIKPGAVVSAEVAVAYDIATGKARQLGVGIGRDYVVGPTEIPGTMDLLIVHDGRVTIVDYKGWQGADDADQNEQTMFYALATSIIYDVGEVDIAIAQEGRDTCDVATLDVLEFDALATRLKRLLGAIEEQQSRVLAGRLPDVSQGDHCRYCPARASGSCPADNALLVRLVDGSEANALDMMKPLSDETASEAYRRWKQATSLLKSIGAALYARAKERPIPVGGGKVFTARASKGNRQLDGKKLHEIVARRYGQHIANAAVTLEATQTQLTEALRLAELKRNESVSSAKESVLDELEKAGGVSRKETEKFDVYPAALVEGRENAA